ncbi:ribonuclease J [bacterium]|nr:MAG: ribonuclease J [bacterium]
MNTVKRTQQKTQLPRKSSSKLRIIPLGGQEEVGRNMTIFEYKGGIIILDMGIQFPEENMPGIDYIIPNISCLKGKEKNILGVVFSHGHLDHIGAAPILLERLGYPPIIGKDITIALIKKRMEDYKVGSIKNLKTINVKSTDDKIRLGEFNLGFFPIEHSVVDAVGVTLSCSEGTIIHPGDWTMDHDAPYDKAISYTDLAKLPKPTLLMLESLAATNYEKPVSEETMNENLEKLIREVSGRLIIGTFASQLKRIRHIIEYTHSVGKKIALDGYSLKTNVELTKELGYINFPAQAVIQVKSIANYPDNKVVVLCTGSQGEERAVLTRIMNDKHRFIKIKKADTIVFSSSVIPGNERTIQSLKDGLYRKCDNIIHSDIMDVHVRGHCVANDIQNIIRQIKPTYFLPVYANHYFLKEAEKLAISIGFPKENIYILDNGSILEISEQKAELLKKKVDTSYVFVDGLGVGDVGNVVIRDRQMMAEDGMFTIIVIIDGKTKKLITNPDVISRGFVYMKGSTELIKATKEKVREIIEKSMSADVKPNWSYLRDHIRDDIGQFLYSKTERRPMVLPVIIEV